MELGHSYIIRDRNRLLLSKVVCKEEETYHLESIVLSPYIEYAAQCYVSSDINVLREVPYSIYCKATDLFKKTIKTIFENLQTEYCCPDDIAEGNCYVMEYEHGIYNFARISAIKPDCYEVDFLEISQYAMNKYSFFRPLDNEWLKIYSPFNPVAFDKLQKMIDLGTSTIRNLIGSDKQN